MRILLTGATGMVGSATCTSLTALGHDVVATDIRPVPNVPVKVLCADLMTVADVYRVTGGCEAVVHFGNHPNAGRCYPPQRLYAENCAMTANVFQAAMDLGIQRIVYASSIQAICGNRFCDEDRDKPSILPSLPLDSRTPLRPGNLYALSKAAGEQMLAYYATQSASLSATALRLPHMMKRNWFTTPAHPVGSGLLDEGMTYLDTDDVGPLVDCILRTNAKGFRAIVPCAENNRLGWDARECIERYFRNVPLLRDLPGTSALVDLDELQRLYGWQPKVRYEFVRWDSSTPSRRSFPFG